MPVLLFPLVASLAQAETLSVVSPPQANLTRSFRVETIASGLNVPWELSFLPGGDALFTERNGGVRMIKSGQLQPRRLLELPVVQKNKSGLLGLAVDPDFADSKQVFLAWNRARGSGSELVVQRYRLDDHGLVDPFTLVEGIPAAANHTGCRLVFGPEDGLLYLSTGDADQPPLAQRLDSTAGKILRIRKDGSIPAANPFANRKDAHPAIYSYGHRNPQGLAFEPSTGRLLASEHGPLHGDELNAITAGGNYGWPIVSHRKTAPGTIPPLVEMTPACGPGPLLFPTGKMFPELRGKLLVANLRDQSIWRFSIDKDGNPVDPERLFHKRFGRIRFLVEAPDGALWISTSMHDPPEGKPGAADDRILRIVADPDAPAPPAREEATGEMPATPPVAQSIDPAPPLGPAQHYAAYCAACHGPALQGNTAPSLLGNPWRRGQSEEAVATTILEGVPSTEMFPTKHLLKPDQALELARWLLQKRAELSPRQGEKSPPPQPEKR